MFGHRSSLGRRPVGRVPLLGRRLVVAVLVLSRVGGVAEVVDDVVEEVVGWSPLSGVADAAVDEVFGQASP